MHLHQSVAICRTLSGCYSWPSRVDKSCQGIGLGVALLQDALGRTIQASGILGIRGLLVHALSIEAKAFYEHHGFIASPTQAMTLILSLKGLV